MDGRVLDPTSPVYKRLEMPHLRALAAAGTNFVNTYAASPQCVPSRTSMFAGRHTHHIQAWNNGQGLAAIPSSGGLDTSCTKLYSEATCKQWQTEQAINATILDSLRALKYESHLYGKVDVGAGILSDWDEPNSTCNGFHSGPSLNILTRTADIRKPTKPDPIKITNDKDNNVHPEDWKMIPKCR
jgi:arylsulfatase A-like enzyme